MVGQCSLEQNYDEMEEDAVVQSALLVKANLTTILFGASVTTPVVY